MLPTAGKHCIRCNEIHHHPKEFLCHICLHIKNYEKRGSIPTPDNGGPEFRFARMAAERFRDVTIQQALKGFEKYGAELDPNMDYDWEIMAEQEVVDLWQYIQCSRARWKELLFENRVAMNRIMELQKERDHWHEMYSLLVDSSQGYMNVPARSENAVSGQMEAVANE